MARLLLTADDFQPEDDPAIALAESRESAIAVAVIAALRAMGDAIDAVDLTDKVRRRDAVGIAAILGGPRIVDVLRGAYAPISDTFLQAAETEAAEKFGGLVVYDPLVAAAELAGARQTFIGSILGQSSQVVLDQLTGALRAGADPDAVAESLKGVIGLTQQQAKAVTNFRALLQGGDREALRRALRDRRFDATVQSWIDGTAQVDAAKVDAMVQRYAERSLAFRAQTIARTESLQAAVGGIRDAYRQAVNSGRLLDSEVRRFWLISEVEPERTCTICHSIPLLNSDGIGVNDEYASLAGPVSGPLAHPRCLPGYQPVIAHNLRATTQRWYDGDLIVIETASGKRLSCTPNHPILTRSGWLSASQVDVGSDVICDSAGQGMPPLIDDNHQHIPASIENVANAFRRFGKVAPIEMPISPEDFHGDGIGSKVCVIWSNRVLHDGWNSSLAEHVAKIIFRARSGIFEHLIGHRSLALLVEGLHSFFGSLVSGHRKLGALVFCCRSHSLEHSFGPVGQPSTSVDQFSNHEWARDASLGGDTLHGHAAFQKIEQLLDINQPSRGAVGAPFASPPQTKIDGKMADRGDADAIMAGDLLQGHFGAVHAEKVIHIDRRPFLGHVFNLETDLGWYVSDGIITHNCRCTERYHTNLTRLRTNPFSLAS